MVLHDGELQVSKPTGAAATPADDESTAAADEVKKRKPRGSRNKHPGVVLIKPDATHPHWRARFRDPDTGRTTKVKIETLAISTKESRREWCIRKAQEIARRKMDLAAGAPRATGTSLKDALDRYFKAHPHLSERTREDTRSATDKLLAWAQKNGAPTADTLTRAKLLGFRESLIRQPKRTVVARGERGQRKDSSRRRSPHSINGDLRKVRTALGYLRKVELLPRLTNDDLRDGLQRLPVTVERIDYLKPAECQQLVEAALRHDASTFAETRREHTGKRARGATHRYEPIAPFVCTVLLTGMRLGEVLALEWKQVDLDALDHDGNAVGEIHLAGKSVKTGRARTVGLEVSPAVRGLLAALRKRNAKGPVFALTEGEAEAAARRLRGDVPRKAKIGKRKPRKNFVEYGHGAPSSFTWQGLRRTCGTYLTNAPGIFGAASAYRSAKQLGHSVQVAEKHYLGLVRGIPREARTLEAAMQIEDALTRVVAGVTRDSRA